MRYGFDLGLNDVNGRRCHVLAFVEKDSDWQIWIDTGPQLTPCKLVITYEPSRLLRLWRAVDAGEEFALSENLY